MTNSVQVALTPSTKTTTVLLLFNHQDTRNKMIVLVEGEDDKTMYRRFFNEEKTYFHVLGGCDGLEQVVADLNQNYHDRLLCVRDADFIRINNVMSPVDNIFLTDYHDAEIMQLSNNGAHNVCQFYCKDRYEISVFEDILNDLRNVSYIKWYCANEHDSGNHDVPCFDNIKISPIYDVDSPIDARSYYEYMCSKQGRPVSILENDIFTFAQAHPNPDLLQITNGHDAVMALYCKIRKYYRTNLRMDKFKETVREQYTYDAFQTSQLYRDISLWLENQGGEGILAS